MGLLAAIYVETDHRDNMIAEESPEITISFHATCTFPRIGVQCRGADPDTDTCHAKAPRHRHPLSPAC